MISTNDFRNGTKIEIDGIPYIVVEFQHVKPGKGGAFVRTKLKNLKLGTVVDKTFRAGEKVPPARLESKKMQYLYRSGEDFYFMEMDTYDQVTIPESRLGDAVNYLKENLLINVMYHKGNTIGVDLPTTVDLKVIQTDPGLRGDTASGGSKPATTETGLVVSVPLFINEGDVLKIDTRSGTYIERA